MAQLSSNAEDKNYLSRAVLSAIELTYAYCYIVWYEARYTLDLWMPWLLSCGGRKKSMKREVMIEFDLLSLFVILHIKHGCVCWLVFEWLLFFMLAKPNVGYILAQNIVARFNYDNPTRIIFSLIPYLHSNKYNIYVESQRTPLIFKFKQYSNSIWLIFYIYYKSIDITINQFKETHYSV